VGRFTGRKVAVTGDPRTGRGTAIAFGREGATVATGYLPDGDADAGEVIRLVEVKARNAVPLQGDIKEGQLAVGIDHVRHGFVIAFSGLGYDDVTTRNHNANCENDCDKGIHAVAGFAACGHMIGRSCKMRNITFITAWSSNLRSYSAGPS